MTHVRIIHRIVPTLTALAVLAGGASSAQAAATTHPDYNKSEKMCNYMGSFDDAGIFYTTCGSKFARYDQTGKRLADLKTSGGGASDDVAPSPDGSIVYTTQGGNPPIRFVRNAAGTYVKDTKWKLENFTYGGKAWKPVGKAIATDARGDIYLSNGSFWVSNTVKTPAAIVKYSPDGKPITAFGDYGITPGTFATNMDVAVSRDGRRVYVGENCGTSCQNKAKDYNASRITRFDYTPGGQYRYTRIISPQGPTNGRPFPQCEDAGAVHSVYTLAMDGFDNLYAGSVSCGYIQRYDTDVDPEKDVFTGTIVKGIGKNHNLSVDWAGRVYAGELGVRYSPKVPVNPAVPREPLGALPAPDITAPVLTAVTLPATTNTRQVAVGITATDNTAVSEMRLGNEDGNYGPWQPFATPATHTLTERSAVKGVFVQVRDMAGNESNAVYKTLRYDEAGAPGEPPAPVPNGDIVAPVIATATVPVQTKEQVVTVTTTATDDRGVTAIRFANEDGIVSAWRPFAAASQWTLTNGAGDKVVSVQVRDAAGNESAAVQARTRFVPDVAPNPPVGGGGAPDLVAPTLTALALPAETTTQGVNVGITAADAVGVTQVRFANEDGNWTAWQAYANPKAWTLSANFGAKLIFVQVRDAAGNESPTLTATTQFVRTAAGPLDAADPVLTAVTLPATMPNANAQVGITATDDIGVTQVRLANEDGNWGAWKAYAGGNVAHALTAGNTNKVVFAQVRDAAGRESNVLFARTLVKP